MVLTIALMGVLGLAFLSISAGTLQEQVLQASNLTQETMEAVRNFRDGVAWNNDDFANEYDGLGVVGIGVPYHPLMSSDVPPRWQLISGAETVNGFTRSVVFDEVRRNASDNIVTTGGTVDPNTKQATVTVSWTEKGRSHQVELVTYFTNWNE